MNITTDMKHSGVSTLPPVSEPGKTAAGQQVADDGIIPGNGVTVVTGQNGTAKVFGSQQVQEIIEQLKKMAQDMLVSMMEEHFEALKAVVDNLKPSERQEEQVEKREEELRKLLDDLKQLIKDAKAGDLERDVQEARFAQILTHNDVWGSVWGPVFGTVMA